MIGSAQLGHGLEREPDRLAGLLEGERSGAVERATVEPGLDQVVVVVAGDDHQLGIAERPGELRERGRRGVERLAQRPVAQLEHVAEQDEPVDPVDRLEQPGPKRLAAHQIGAAGQPEVEIGNDRGAHARIVAAGGDEPQAPTGLPAPTG